MIEKPKLNIDVSENALDASFKHAGMTAGALSGIRVNSINHETTMVVRVNLF